MLTRKSLTYFPDPPEFKVGPEAYLDHIAQAKAAVDIPIIGSLNGTHIWRLAELRAADRASGR